MCLHHGERGGPTDDIRTLDRRRLPAISNRPTQTSIPGPASEKPTGRAERRPELALCAAVNKAVDGFDVDYRGANLTSTSAPPTSCGNSHVCETAIVVPTPRSQVALFTHPADRAC